MEFRLLGPLEVLRDGHALAVGGAKQRALLALLLLRANEVVSRDLLIEELWGDRPPGTAAHSLDVQISRLRKTLDPAAPLLTRSTGYVLEIDPEQLDVRRFEQLLEEGRRANAAGKPSGALALLERALSLWRGPALADFTYESFARSEIERLEDLRLAAIEERVEAELALGRHEAVVPELEALAVKHPLRERLRGQQMVALYRSGRQAEALSVYAELRRQLSEELGLEPSQALRELDQSILRQDPSLDFAPAESRVRRRRGVAAAIVLAAAAGAAAGGVLLAHGGTQSSQARSLAERNSVSLVSEASAKVVGQAAAQAPLDSRFGLGALWNISFAGVLTRIDPASGRITGFVNAVPIPCGLDVGEGSVWVTDCTSPTLVRIDPKQVVVIGKYRLPVPPEQPYQATQTQSVALGAGSVWVGQGTDNPSHVYRLDPGSGQIQKSIVIPEGGAGALAFGDGALWVAGGIIGRLSRIDPRTNAVTTPARDLGKWTCCVAVGGGYVWAAVGGTLWKISEDGQVLSSTKVPASIAGLRYAEGAAWAAVGDAGTVVRVDATSDESRTYRIGHQVEGVDARRGVLAVSVQSAGEDVTAGLKGKVVYVALTSDTLDSNTSTDPVGAQSWNADQTQFHYATCAKLFNYPDDPGAAGTRLVPEVAAGWPKVRNGGRTYTFTIRPGFGFSPPSREQVTAESFRHEIERYLKQPGPWSLQTLGDVVGAEAFNAGQAAHVSGITANGDTLVIRLSRPAGDLPARLARPAFCAVPADLPTVPGGLPFPIRTGGPYYLADRSRDVFVLKPNPNYHGPRPQRLDAIVYRTGVPLGDAAAQVAQGKLDYVQDRGPALAPNTAAARTAGPRYRLTPNNSTDRLALNTRRPLFADARVRQAVQDALDRRVLAGSMDGSAFELPTSRLLPPDLGGFIGGSGLRSSAGVRAARKLMGGRHLHAVLAAYAPATGGVYDPGLVEALRRQLAAIGIAVRVVPLRQGSSPATWASVLAHADITRIATAPGDVNDAVGYLFRLPYLPAADRGQLGRIAALASPRRDPAAILLAAKLQREAVYIGLADAATPELVSKRLGCVIDQPRYPGVDLAALCLRDTRR